MRDPYDGEEPEPVTRGRTEALLLTRLKPAVAHALRHPLRRAILRQLNLRPNGARAAEIAEALREANLSRVTYHLRVLHQHGVLTATANAHANGFPSYASTLADDPAVTEFLTVTDCATPSSDAGG